MKTLLEQINEYKQEIFARNAAIQVYEVALKNLEDSRVNCPHEFSKPIINYEHEGGTCIKCGINELYAHTLSKG